MYEYTTIHETTLLTFQSSSMGDVIVTRKSDGKEVYFQPGYAGSEILEVLGESPPDDALHIYMDGYFAG